MMSNIQTKLRCKPQNENRKICEILPYYTVILFNGTAHLFG